MTDATTLLVMSGVDVPPYAARGINQTWEPIEGAGNLRRTLNGVLRNNSAPQFQKIRSTISCADQQPPGVNGTWPGKEVTVDCAYTLSYKTIGGAPAHAVVPGSSYVDGDYTIYQPRLEMRVVTFSGGKEEYAAIHSWSMVLEEI